MRRKALDTSLDALPNGRQIGEIEARLVPIYLLQRYQGEALARLIGGGEFDYSTSGDVKAGLAHSGVRAVSASTQRAALSRLVDSLRAEHLALPARVLDLLTPPAQGYERNREYFATRMNSVFDALSAVEAGSALTTNYLLDAGRVNRLAWQHARDAGQPGVPEVFSQILQRTWKRDGVPPTIVGGEAVQLASNWAVLDTMLNLLEGGKLHASVDAEVRQQLRRVCLAQAASRQGRHVRQPRPGRRLDRALPV